MTEAAKFRPDGVEFSADKLLEHLNEKKPLDDLYTHVTIMKAYFHVFCNVRYITRDAELCAIFERLRDEDCAYSDVFDGLIIAYKQSGRDPRDLRLLRDMLVDHMIVLDDSPGAAEGATTCIAVARPADRPLRREPHAPSSAQLELAAKAAQPAPPQEGAE